MFDISSIQRSLSNRFLWIQGLLKASDGGEYDQYRISELSALVHRLGETDDVKFDGYLGLGTSV